ncbi:CD1375 family protein [Geomicrobium sediminis]|uniref:Uncharacterized protein n=1 Tax=Geomicrobium sediminis TaxID=1347788 RepID=A0ABS2PFR9_9BACL|nr:CD1375 family protein [Geomicrobium sediminis]MBM7634092.1 hypothetical protein [Geomicrobium sediminis]
MIRRLTRNIRIRTKLILFAVFGKGADEMVTVYVTLIVAGRREFDSVPFTIRDEVRKDLEAMGLSSSGQVGKLI